MPTGADERDEVSVALYCYVGDVNKSFDVFGLMDPLSIQFSQTSISDTFSDGPWKGKSLDEAIDATIEAGKLPNGLTLNVMELNGGRDIVTLNNRTLHVAQMADLEYVKVNFSNDINKLEKLMTNGTPLALGEYPEVKCKK